MSQDSEDRSDRSRWLGIVQSAAILVLIVLALYLARAPDRVERQDVADPAIQSGIPSVQVIRPEPTEQSLGVRLTGSVRLERKARVVSEVMGRVVWVSPSFSNGGSIPAGETFLRIDPAEYRLRVESAQAAVSEARAAGGSMLALAQTALKLAELQLRRTDISLPYDSRVVSSDVEVGELVGPSEQVGRDASVPRP